MMKLIFVYNAHSGLINTIKDALHKTFIPKSYPCSLCALTYGSVSEKKHWKEFHQQSEIEMEFLHIDEFEEKYQQHYLYPVVIKASDLFEIAISSSQLDAIKTVEELILHVNQLNTNH